MRNGAKGVQPDKDADWPRIVEAEDDERERRLRALLSRMTLNEKIGQMSGDLRLIDIPLLLIRYNTKTFNAGANKRLGIPPLRFRDGPRGATFNNSTCFPVAIARSASWDPDLHERVGSAMGVEGRAQGANLLAAVCVNILRHPAWGRAQETFGEDTYLSGQLGAAMVKGLQNHVMACVKHFACNSIEGSRMYVDVRIDERSLREIYLPQFKRCVLAGAACVMSAYNRVNGRYCSENSHLLSDILKGEWGFEGFVMSDFIRGTRSTVGAARAGLDMEMPNARFFGRRLRNAIWKGKLEPQYIDEAAHRILREKARFYTGKYEGSYGRDRVACKEHVGLALEAACKSIVLLKNKGGALPLKPGAVSRIAVIGTLADIANLGDHGSSRVIPPYAVTPLQGLENRLGGSVQLIHVPGGDTQAAREAARHADATVIVAGLTARDEGEDIPFIKGGGDRESLGLAESDVELIAAVCEESKRSIVVLEGGSAITMEGWRDKPQAILMAWYPGMEGGNAIADILLGNVNPSGKLPLTFPKTAEQLPYFDSRRRSIQYGYFHGYRLFEKTGVEPAFAFGHGLSYTRYAYGNLRLSEGEIIRDGALEVLVDIGNEGDMAGDEIVQMYVGYPESKIKRPLKELKGFTRIRLLPGESKTVSIPLRAEDLAYYDEESRAWHVEEGEYAVYVGQSSRRDDLLAASFRLSD